ncbi:MAG: type II toxin-antitoxin system VapC family toxin [Actinomycetia bacterium]|nr:type II toxin-antitoxin system VapC family toxin [Actinomycetes bacterium]
MIVVDASMALAWCFEDEATDDTDRVLARVRQEGGTAPVLWRYEVGNALLSARRRDRVTDAQLQRLTTLLAALPVALDLDVPSATDLISAAQRHELTAYDVAYLLVAQRQGLPLATMDKQLAVAAIAAGVTVLPSVD